jgi:hypothetical protein
MASNVEANSVMGTVQPSGATRPPYSILPLRTSNSAHLLDEAGAGPEDRVLIIGAPDAELLCEALRHGCRAASEVMTPPAHPEPANVVVAPRVATEADAAAVASCARRALAAGGLGGRLALSLLGRGGRALALTLVDRLRAYGFERITLRARAEGELLLVCFLSRPLPAAVPARARAGRGNSWRQA